MTISDSLRFGRVTRATLELRFVAVFCAMYPRWNALIAIACLAPSLRAWKRRVASNTAPTRSASMPVLAT